MTVRRRAPALALVIALLGAGAAQARPAEYFGHTGQRPGRHGKQRLPDNEVYFRVAGDEVRDFTITWLAPCFDDYRGKPDAPLIDRSSFDALPLRNGRFVIRGAGYRMSPGPGQVANIRLVLRGLIEGRHASGTLVVKASIDVEHAYTSDYCFTRKPIRWRATLDG